MKTFVSFFLPFFCCVTCFLHSVDVVLWHAFDGFLKEKFHEVVADFNAQSDDCQILPVYQGNYREVLEKGMQAYQDKDHPHILHVYEVETLSMMLRPDLFKPVGDIIEEREINRYLRSVKAFYSDLNGEMLSFPWNISTGVLFYNKEAFKKAGLDPECPPKTWVELEKVGEKLVQHGFQGFTTGGVTPIFSLSAFKTLFNFI